ncbi:hypothetical protein LTR36_006987 [Oleoguttula mirabilis]|uniref:Sodium/calcium exchanger membrane region domain-containing protein n=1 Tax=Oleoguttula mirabilis TaxID=1507867 RepID=A0AAV9JBF2_9PEZI|nr:hypothetical protein LTR36_006987 [Oleoguttula mirabilis]
MGKISDILRSDRYRSEARQHAGRSTSNYGDGNEGPILPLHKPKTDAPRSEAGGLNEKDGRGGFPTPSAAGKQRDGGSTGGDYFDGGPRDVSGNPEASTRNNAADAIPATIPPPAPPPHKSEDAGTGVSTVTPDSKKDKPNITTRVKAGCKRFGVHTKNALFHSWVNVLLVFVPIGIIMKALGLSATLVFAMNAIAIVPLAGLLSHATESVASRMGDTLGALLNVSFGNAVELIIFIIALVKNEIRIVQASLLGSILANLLLILGMAFLFGGLRYREQIYNSTVTQMSACLVSLSVMSLLLPTAFHASFNESSTAAADLAVLKVSRGTSVILLLVYFLYLLFQLKSHAYMYESTPQAIIDEESHPGVLHDMMNSSSSSDDSSSSDSTDSDTSGSIMTTGKKLRKKMFRRRRRKSSASASSTTPSSVVQSALSSPSMERQGSYWEAQVTNHQAARRESALGVIASGDEGDADQEEGRHNIMPRIRDFVRSTEDGAPVQDDAKSPERRRHKRKQYKRHQKKHHRHSRDEEKLAAEEQDKTAAEAEKAAPISELKVGFADDIEVAHGQSQGQQSALDQSPGKLPFNMRQLSSRVAYRPALPKMLSNTVFTTPAPPLEPPRRYAQPIRARPTGSGLRRASSLPEMQREASTPTNPAPTSSRTDPLPPFQHQRQQIRKVQSENDEIAEDDIGEQMMSRTAAVVLLLCSTALVAVCAEFMVDAIPSMIASNSNVSQAFIGLIILPIVGNAAEHVTAVTVATKNKMDLAIGVAVGSSIQIALFVTPIVVLLGWVLDTQMSLYFNLFETIALFATAFVVNFLVLDGRSNYLEGSLLIAAYVIIALGAFFYPSTAAQSEVGGAGTA